MEIGPDKGAPRGKNGVPLYRISIGREVEEEVFSLVLGTFIACRDTLPRISHPR
jgi:hypothetical protein